MPKGVFRGRRTGPHSRTLRRGVIGNHIDGRSELGRFIRELETQLFEHVGPNPPLPVKLHINSIVRMHVQLQLLEERITAGEYTDLDARTCCGLYGSIRRSMAALPGKPAPAQVKLMTPLEYAASKYGTSP